MLVTFLSLGKNLPEMNQLTKRKYLFWLMISEGLVHGCLVFGPMMRQNIMVESVWWSQPVHIMAIRNESGREGEKEEN